MLDLRHGEVDDKGGDAWTRLICWFFCVPCFFLHTTFLHEQPCNAQLELEYLISSLFTPTAAENRSMYADTMTYNGTQLAASCMKMLRMFHPTTR